MDDKDPINQVAKKSDIALREEETLAMWQEKGIFEKSLEQTKDGGEFVFYDGPPFATGLPHYGHLLASVVLASLNAARLKARNAARISELVQIKKALELYYDDHGVYPSSNNPNSDCGWGTPPGDDPNNIIPGLVPDYLPEISTDPTHRYVADPLFNQSCKSYFSDGREYKFSLLNLRDPSSGASVFDYSVYPAFMDPLKDGGDPCVVETDGKDNGAGNMSWVISTEGVCATHWWQ